MDGDVADDSMTNNDPVVDEAAESSSAAIDNLANDIQSGTDTVTDNDHEVTKSLEGIQTGLGLTELPSNAMIDDANLENPTTPDGEKLKSWFDSFKKSFSNAAENETPESLYEKLGGGKTAFIALILIGVIASIVTLNDMADALTGCYMLTTDTSGNTFNQPVKTSCSKATCNCTNITQCIPNASPCPGTTYFWKKVTPLQALAILPGLAAKSIAAGILQPTSGFLNSVKGPIIVVGVMIILIILAYTAYKYFSK